MKTLSASLAIVALLASPAFAAQSQSVSQSASGPAKSGTQANIISDTKLNDVNAIAVGPGSEVKTGVVENHGDGVQTNVINKTSVEHSNMIATDGGKVLTGVVSNQ